jgi:thiamine pyrophosphokinase
MQAIVLADGEVGARADLDAAWPRWLELDAVVIGADGGARHAEALGLTIDHWVGDGDSLGPEGVADLRAAGIPVELVTAAKDESDTELAILWALELGADRIVVLGALGGPRLDHALANVGLLALPALRDIPACLLGPTARITLISAPDGAGEPVYRALPGPEDAIVSLLPQGDGVVGVTTQGLAYRLEDEPLPAGPARGLSNIRVDADAAVTVRAGRLLVIEAPATLST